MATTLEEIQARLDGLPVLMNERGLVAPWAQMTIRSQSGAANIFVADKSDASNKHVYSASVIGAIEAAEAYIAALPSAKDARRAKFLELAAAAADYAAEHMPDDEFASKIRAEIVDGMKRMSEAAIAYDPVAVPTQDDYGDMNDRAEKLAEKWEREQ